MIKNKIFIIIIILISIISSFSQQCLYDAAKYGDLLKLKELENEGINLLHVETHPTSDFAIRQSAIKEASNNNQDSVLMYLIDYGLRNGKTETWLDTMLSIGVNSDTNIVLFTFLINKGANPFANCYSEYSIIYKAIRIGNLSIIKFLVEEFNATITQKEIHNAFYYQRKNILEYLKNDLKILIKEPKNRTYLRSYNNWDWDFKKYAIDSFSCDVNKICAYGEPSGLIMTPLMIAAEDCDTIIIEYLLTKGANLDFCNSANRTAIDYANCEEVENYLEARGLERNIDYCSKIIKEIVANNVNGVKQILELGFDINSICLRSSSNPNFYIDAARSLEMLKLLINAGIIIQEGNHVRTPLCQAINNGRGLKYIQYLVDSLGFDVNEVKGTDKTPPLLRAIYSRGYNYNPDAIISYLIEKGADVNAVSYDGISLFYSTCQVCDETTARKLIENGAIVDKNPFDYIAKCDLSFFKFISTLNYEFDTLSLFHDYILNKNFEMIDYLIDSLNVKYNPNDTTIMDIHLDDNTLTYFLKMGLNINVAKNNGKNLLMKAVECNNNKMVYRLVNEGINIFAVDNENNTAIDYLSYDYYNSSEYRLIKIYLQGKGLKSKDNSCD